MGGKKNFRTIVDRNKKQRSVWRPIATQAGAAQDSGSQIQEDERQHLQVHCSMSGNTSSNQPGKDVAEAANESRPSQVETGHSSEKHSIKLEVGTSLFRFVKGKGGSTQKTIEEEMDVKIMIPSSKEEEYVTIEGFSIDSVTRASEKIKDIIDEAVRGPNLDYSHFVSLPLAIHPELVDKLFDFQKSILNVNNSSADEDQESASDEDSTEHVDKNQNADMQLDIAVELKVQDGNENVEVKMTEIQTVSYPPKASKTSSVSGMTANISSGNSEKSCYLTSYQQPDNSNFTENFTIFPDLGIDKSIFIKPKTFHLTVLMLKLWNKDRVKAATEVLQSISSKVMDAVDNRPVSIRLKGLDSMKGPLAKARVLYVPVEETGNEDRLMRASQIIIDAYVEAGLVLEKDAKQKLKLHATVMNARHRKRNKRTRKVDSFDARGIFKQYGSEEWGEYLIREAHLSKRFAFDENGYYNCCCSIPFPQNMYKIE